jgi:hypothetical protein
VGVALSLEALPIFPSAKDRFDLLCFGREVNVLGLGSVSAVSDDSPSPQPSPAGRGSRMVDR